MYTAYAPFMFVYLKSAKNDRQRKYDKVYRNRIAETCQDDAKLKSLGNA